MRIAFITYEFPPDTGKGGIGTYTRQVAEMLAARNWDVHVFCGTPEASSSSIEKLVKIHRVHCLGVHDFGDNVVPAFSHLQHAQTFDIAESPEIHSNASTIKRLFPSLPLVIRLHAPNSLVEHMKKRYIPFRKKLRFTLGALRRFRWDAGYWKKYDKHTDSDYLGLATAKKIVAPSQWMKAWAVAHWGTGSREVEVLPNIFYPDPAFLQIPLPVLPGNKTILFFGRLNVLKGLVNATYAMKHILQKHKDWRFTLIGDDAAGPDGSGSMQQWISHQLTGFQDRLHFEKGMPHEELPRFLAGADIILLPSLFESFSYTCLEAMAAARPVVGSKGTGMEAIISHNKDGLLADPDNPKDIAECIALLINKPDLRIALAEQGRKTACGKFSPHILCNQYEKLYREAVHE